MKKDKDIGIFRKLALKVITVLQVSTIKMSNTEFYYKLTKLHFRLYFGRSLNLSISFEEMDAVSKRHAKMVVSVLFPDSKKAQKRMVYAMAKASFLKILALEADLETVY